MVEISVQPLFHLLAHLYVVAQAVIFAAIVTMMLPRRFAAKVTRKLVLAHASASDRKTNLTEYHKRRNF